MAFYNMIDEEGILLDCEYFVTYFDLLRAYMRSVQLRILPREFFREQRMPGVGCDIFECKLKFLKAIPNTSLDRLTIVCNGISMTTKIFFDVTQIMRLYQSDINAAKQQTMSSRSCIPKTAQKDSKIFLRLFGVLFISLQTLQRSERSRLFLQFYIEF